MSLLDEVWCLGYVLINGLSALLATYHVSDLDQSSIGLCLIFSIATFLYDNGGDINGIFTNNIDYSENVGIGLMVMRGKTLWVELPHSICYPCPK